MLADVFARVAQASRLAGPLRSQDRPLIGGGDRDVARFRGAHTRKAIACHLRRRL